MSTISITRKYTPGDGKQYAQFVDAARAVEKRETYSALDIARSSIRAAAWDDLLARLASL